MTAPSPLPDGIFAAALAELHRVNEQRVRSLYNRPRAVLAEFLVASLLPGSSVEVDPSAAWDVSWPVDGAVVRLQVKCSGEVLPHNPPGTATSAIWEVRTPSTAWDPEAHKMVAIDAHQCDLFMLARHVGSDIERGWTFRVVRPGLPDGRWRPKQLDATGAYEVPPSELADTVRHAL